MSIREITDHYQKQMRETHERHMARVAEIEAENFRRGLILVIVIAFFFAAPFIGVWLR